MLTDVATDNLKPRSKPGRIGAGDDADLVCRRGRISGYSGTARL